MNTKMNYLYRDGWNYKTGQEVILKGEITEKDRQMIKDALDRLEGESFIPEQIGLPLIRAWEYNEEADHPYCELYPDDDFELTDEEPTDNRTIHELAQDFANVEAWNGWLY